MAKAWAVITADEKKLTSFQYDSLTKDAVRKTADKCCKEWSRTPDFQDRGLRVVVINDNGTSWNVAKEK